MNPAEQAEHERRKKAWEDSQAEREALAILMQQEKEKEQAQLTIEEKFYNYLPDTLYKSHYTLAQDYGNTPQEWRKFLRDNNLFIETELASIAEAEARSALSRLGNATGTEVSAIKALLESSKLINDSQKQKTKVVLTFIPNAERNNDDENNGTEHQTSL
jgi:hypothetical protein